MPYYDVAQRAAAIVLKVNGYSDAQITEQTGIPGRTVLNLLDKAISRGYNPDISKTVFLKYVEDAEKSGRPPIDQEIKDKVIKKISLDRYAREKTCAQIAHECKISAMSVWRILKKAGFRKTKPTRKPGLQPEDKARRLKFCLDHKDWTLDDWKNVIWSDETSVVLNFRRGGYRVWRRSDERFVKSCIRPRWKGYSEFMFWACFTYDRKVL
jgi:transposase